MAPVVHSARPDEARVLAELAAATFTESFGHLYKPEDVAAFLAKDHSVDVYEKLLANDRYALWLAVSDNEASEPVGYCVAGPCSLPAPDKPENSGELLRLYIKASHHGGGLGGCVLATALDWLRPRFVQSYISVARDNPGAQRLYERYGFVKAFDSYFMVGNHRDPEWIMMLRR